MSKKKAVQPGPAPNGKKWRGRHTVILIVAVVLMYWVLPSSKTVLINPDAVGVDTTLCSSSVKIKKGYINRVRIALPFSELYGFDAPDISSSSTGVTIRDGSSGENWFSMGSFIRARIIVTLRNPESIRVRCAQEVRITGLKGDNASVNIDGGYKGKPTIIKGVDVNHLSVTTKGVDNMVVSGRAETQDWNIRHWPDEDGEIYPRPLIDASQLAGSTATVFNRASMIVLGVTDSITTTLKKGGQLLYTANPEIKETDESVEGEVRAINDSDIKAEFNAIRKAEKVRDQQQ